MQFHRLSIESGDRTFTLELHPRLTIISGVGPLEREGLITELIGSLSTGRSGVHVEVCSDAGARFLVARPAGRAPRIIEVGQGRDVTDLFTAPDGRVNLLERAGLTLDAARDAMRLTQADLITRSQDEARMLRLARVDQGRLWDVARKVKDRETDVARITAEVGSDSVDGPMLAEIERRHAEFEKAEEGHEQARRASLLVGTIAMVLVAPLADSVGFVAAALAAIIAIAATAYSFAYWRRMESTRREQDRLLDEAGATSYLAFQLTKVNGLLSDDRLRQELIVASEYQRSAAAEWQLLTDGVDIDWALAHRREIRAAATRLRESVEVRNPMATTLSADEEVTAELAHAVTRRANHLRQLGAGGESFPMFVDEAFRELESDGTKTDLLRLLERVSEGQQVIVLTADDSIARWARVEADNGKLGLVEPVNTSNRAATGAEGSTRTGNNGHVAA